MRIALFLLLLGAIAAMPPEPHVSHAWTVAPRTVPRNEPSPDATIGGIGGAVAFGWLMAQPSATDMPYLIGRGPCVAIEEGQSFERGARLLALAPGKTTREVTVEELRPWTGPSRGSPRRPRTDCTSWFEEDVTGQSGDRHVLVPLTSLARVSNPPDDGDAFFALAPQPARTIIAGMPRPVGPAERRRLLTVVRRSLPASWASARTLVRAQRYGPTRGHEVIELSLGWPTRNARGVTPPIKHVAIRQFFLVDGRVAASENYERTSGVEERVDTAPPELTDDNWFVLDAEATVAFVSSDDGASWARLSTNVGFESTIWLVQGLRDGLPVLFRRELYTHH